MILIDTSYDMKYESRRECRQRIFDPEKSYFFYLDDPDTKRQIAVCRDYDFRRDDFQMVWGLGVRNAERRNMQEVIHEYGQRASAMSHHDRYTLLVFELTDSEIEKHVLMEIM